MTERRVAFILAGGASRGAYQAGCLKRLEEEGVRPDIVVGSSIGVCNALIHETGGAEALWAFWSRALSLPRVLDVSLRRNVLTGNSLLSSGRLVRYLEQEIDFDRCFASERELAFVVANLSAGREELRGNRTEPDVERFRAVARAGYTIPVLHPLVEIGGDLYADGGLLASVPLDYVEERGATEVYVLSATPSELPRADSLRFAPQVALRLYELISRGLSGPAAVEQRARRRGRRRGARVTLVRPSPETGRFDPLRMLDARPSKSRRLLLQGYRDTERALYEPRTRAGADPSAPSHAGRPGAGRR